MANVLQTKMMTINELMVTLHGEDLEKPIDHPEYLSLVREKKDWDGATKEELLSHVQVIHSVEIIDIYCCCTVWKFCQFTLDSHFSQNYVKLIHLVLNYKI